MLAACSFYLALYVFSFQFLFPFLLGGPIYTPICLANLEKVALSNFIDFSHLILLDGHDLVSTLAALCSDSLCTSFSV